MNRINIPLTSIVLLLSVVGIVLILRYESQYQQNKDPLPKEPPVKELQEYRIFTLDGCEYLVVGVGQARWGSHKGDCKNPIHYTK
jgi:hypothetical protein